MWRQLATDCAHNVQGKREHQKSDWNWINASIHSLQLDQSYQLYRANEFFLVWLMEKLSKWLTQIKQSSVEVYLIYMGLGHGQRRNLHSLEKAEHMMVRWMFGVPLKDRKQSEVLYSLLGVQSVPEVVIWGVVDWDGLSMWNVGVSACRNVVVAEVRCVSRGRKTWRECVKDDTDELGFHPEWAVFRDMWRGLISGKMSNPSWAREKWALKK